MSDKPLRLMSLSPPIGKEPIDPRLRTARLLCRVLEDFTRGEAELVAFIDSVPSARALNQTDRG